MTDLLVLHDLGASGGAEWAEAFADWPGRVLAPDLPGHNTTPPPVGGNYETGDAVYAALDRLRDDPPDNLIVVGVGHNGAAAQILALGGRAAALVLVDGLGGPWLTPVEIDMRLREMRRHILSTPGAMGQPAAGTSDPRAALVVGAADREFAVRQAAAMPVPVLLIETPSSPTPDAADLAAEFPQAIVSNIGTRTPAAVAAVATSWWTTR